MSQVIEVTIFGKQYPVMAAKDPEYIRMIAQMVDQKMKEIAEKIPDTPTSGIAILACLNIIDELITFKEHSSKTLVKLDDKIASLIRDINSRIAG